QVISIFAGVRGLVDDVKVADIKKFGNGLLTFIEDKHKSIIDAINETKKLDDNLESQLKAAILEYKDLFNA
ncbi:MAG: F0F1 ATP synthase subunit alpha, partial [Nitrospinaceae bacterium]